MSQSQEEGNGYPKALDTIKSAGGFAVVSPDKLSVKYPGVGLHEYGVIAVQADRPAPSKCMLYYFEITVKNAGAKGYIGIGFTTSNYNLRRQPGWDADSCGYHGDDGHLYRNKGTGEFFGPTFTTGDIVGGGINNATQEFFFTKNGVLVGTVNKDFEGPVFPTIGLQSQDEEVTVNFGNEPYAFDLKAYEEEQRAKQQKKIDSLLPPEVTSYGKKDLRKEDVICYKEEGPPNDRTSTNSISNLENNVSYLENKITSLINIVQELSECIKDIKVILEKMIPKEYDGKTKGSVKKIKNFEKIKENNLFLRHMLFISWIAFIVCFVVRVA